MQSGYWGFWLDRRGVIRWVSDSLEPDMPHQTSEPTFAPARLAVLLQHFAQIDDDRESWRVAYPLKEVLLLVTCATIASCDDFEAIVLGGEHHWNSCAGSVTFIMVCPAPGGCAI